MSTPKTIESLQAALDLSRETNANLMAEVQPLRDAFAAEKAARAVAETAVHMWQSTTRQCADERDEAQKRVEALEGALRAERAKHREPEDDPFEAHICEACLSGYPCKTSRELDAALAPPSESAPQPQPGAGERAAGGCLHEKLTFGSGGYYIFCASGCNNAWRCETHDKCGAPSSPLRHCYLPVSQVGEERVRLAPAAPPPALQEGLCSYDLMHGTQRHTRGPRCTPDWSTEGPAVVKEPHTTPVTLSRAERVLLSNMKREVHRARLILAALAHIIGAVPGTEKIETARADALKAIGRMLQTFKSRKDDDIHPKTTEKKE